MLTALAAETIWILQEFRAQDQRRQRSRFAYGSLAQWRERRGSPRRVLCGVYCCPQKVVEPSHSCPGIETFDIEWALGIDPLPSWADARLKDLAQPGAAREGQP